VLVELHYIIKNNLTKTNWTGGQAVR